jgi:hypothetical protein
MTEADHIPYGQGHHGPAFLLPFFALLLPALQISLLQFFKKTKENRTPKSEIPRLPFKNESFIVYSLLPGEPILCTRPFFYTWSKPLAVLAGEFGVRGFHLSLT